MNIMNDLTSNATSPMEIALIALAVAFIAVIIAKFIRLAYFK